MNPHLFRDAACIFLAAGFLSMGMGVVATFAGLMFGGPEAKDRAYGKVFRVLVLAALICVTVSIVLAVLSLLGVLSQL